MKVAKRLLAGAGAVAMVASAAMLGFASPAQAAGQTISVTPNSNLKGGEVVTVEVSGFSANAPIAIGACPTGRKVQGPGDCGRSKDGFSKLVTADASGKATAQITVPKGALGNATPPAAKCPPCSIGAANIANPDEIVDEKLNYATAGSSSNATTQKAATTKTKAADTALAKTGPRETLIMALVGFALLQVGLIFAVRATRSAPRRSAI